MSRRRGPARCRDCGTPVVFLRSPFTGSMRPFNPTPVDGRDPLAVTAYPVLGRAAFKYADLVEHIQIQRGCSDTEAADEVRDMPWRFIHDCTTTTSEEETP